jgi:hypothetical protein
MTDSSGRTNIVAQSSNLTSGKLRRGETKPTIAAGSLDPTKTDPTYGTGSSDTSASLLAGGTTSSTVARFSANGFIADSDEFIVPEGEWIVSDIDLQPGTTNVVSQSLRRFWSAQYPMVDDQFAFRQGASFYGGPAVDGSFNPEVPPLTGSFYSRSVQARGITRGSLIIPTELEKGYTMRSPNPVIFTPRIFVPNAAFDPGQRALGYPTPHQISCSVLENYKILIPYQAIGLNFLAITRIAIQTPQFNINTYEGPDEFFREDLFGSSNSDYYAQLARNVNPEYYQYLNNTVTLGEFNTFGLQSPFGNLLDSMIELGEVEYCISGPMCKEITTGVWSDLSSFLTSNIYDGSSTGNQSPVLPVYDDPIAATGWTGVYDPVKIAAYWNQRLLYGESGTSASVDSTNIGLQWSRTTALTANPASHGGPIGSSATYSFRPPEGIGHPRLPNGRQVGRVTSWKPYGTIDQLKNYDSVTGFVCGPGIRKDAYGNVFRKAIALRHRFPELAPDKLGVYAINSIHMTGHITVRGSTYL